MPSRRSASPLLLRRPATGWPVSWFRHKRDEPKHPIFDIPAVDLLHSPSHEVDPTAESSPDLTCLLSDELLQRVLSLLPAQARHSARLVSRRWLRLLGQITQSLTLLDWSFLHSSAKMTAQFPALAEVNLVPASFNSQPLSVAAGIVVVVTRGAISVPMAPSLSPLTPWPAAAETVDRGLETIARGWPNLRKLSMMAVGSEMGLMKLAEYCPTLQELDLHCCTDQSLRAISVFPNLQVLRLGGAIQGLQAKAEVTDVGLTILAHGCRRLVKLELGGCGGGYEGIAAIGRCCLMLEELTVSGHRMAPGWIAGLADCANLKTLRIQGCRRLNDEPETSAAQLGSCLAIERLHLRICQLRSKRALASLLLVSHTAKEIVFQDCWGLDDAVFGSLAVCRRVKLLAMEGCSKVTTAGLEGVVLQWPDLERLRVASCNKIKDEEVTPAMSNLFARLKELQWRPDSKSALAGTGIGKKCGRLLRRL
ncbi:F-box protein At5g07670-like [Wolffia australiana]